MSSVLLFTTNLAAQKSDKPATAPAEDQVRELVALRTAYEGSLMPYGRKLETAISTRAEQYAKDLKTLADQLAPTGKVDALELLKAERDAYAPGGNRSSGFDDDEKKVPSAARTLRRTYDQDCEKIRNDHAVAARPAAVKYLKELTDLETTMARSSKADAFLAIRRERRVIDDVTHGDPLYGGDNVLAVAWKTKEKTWVNIKPDGKMSDQSGASGHWEWSDRGKRKVTLNWKGDLGTRVYILSPDGGGLLGTTAKRKKTVLDRQPPSKK